MNMEKHRARRKRRTSATSGVRDMNHLVTQTATASFLARAL